jgi:diguanylate cyclase (GGDEF)-like protein/PAS domain S-box-containing protein
MKIHFGLVRRLALALIAIALLSQYINYRSAGDLLKTSIQQRETDKIKSIARFIEPRLNHDVDSVRAISHLIQHELSVAMQNTGATRAEAVASILDRTYRESEADALEVTDDRGIVIYRAHEPNRNGDQATAWGVEEALSGSENAVSVRTIHGPLISYIQPIRVGQRIIGTINSSIAIDSTFIKKLAAETGAELALVDRTGTVLASSNPSMTSPDNTAIKEAFQQKIPSYRTIEKTLRSVTYLPILVVDEACVIMAEIDSSSAFSLLEQSNKKASLSTSIITVCAILITLLTLRFSLIPLRSLRRRAESMVSELTDTPPSTAPSDDVTALVSTLDTLTSTLVERNRELTEQRADLRISAAAFESQQGMMITDANAVILRVNKAYTEITGHAPTCTIGQTARIFCAKRYGHEFNQQLLKDLQSKGSWQGEVEDQRKNGDSYPKWITVAAVKNHDDQLTHYIITHLDISEQKRTQKVIEELAFYDALTRLPNRSLLIDRLKQAIISGKRNNTFGALLFINLDNFKALNDTLGRDHGDQLLKQVAQRLITCIRADDTVARVDSDEFVVVLGNLSGTLREAATQTEIVGEKILNALEFKYQAGDFVHQNSASIGVTLFGGQDVSIDDLLRQADLAMHQAKDSLRNSLSFFDPEMQIIILERAYLENDLREALNKKEFVLHYQPQVDNHGHVTGAEVLLRWKHPARGMVSPASFIPLAEESGLILPLGNWVLETACIQLAQWSSQPVMDQLSIAVNVSAKQFHHPDFVNQVLALLNSSGAPAQRLKLELTESMLVQNVEELIEKMAILQTAGVSFSLDDFGTGYSSLSYLKRLPLGQLKIDQSFVRDVLTDSNDASIATTIVALAHSLGLKVIAEGVETEGQRNFLRSTGCDAYQGYFYSRPIPVEDFEVYSRQSLIFA